MIKSITKLGREHWSEYDNWSAIAIIRDKGIDECYMSSLDSGVSLKMHECFIQQNHSAETLHRQINNSAEHWALWGIAVSSATDVSEPSGLCNKEVATASYSFYLCPWNLAHIPTKASLTVWLKCLMWSKIVILNSQRVTDQSMWERL